MQISTCKITLRISHSHNLKEKRQVIKSLTTHIRNKFNVAVAEVDHNDKWQIATLGIVTVSNSSRNSESVIAKILHYIHHEIRTDSEIIAQHQNTFSG